MTTEEQIKELRDKTSIITVTDIIIRQSWRSLIMNLTC